MKQMMMFFFWVFAPCRLISRCQHFGETLASTNESTWRQNPEEEHHHPQHHEALKSNKMKMITKKSQSRESV
jgi:hypothetical protein